MVIGKLKLPPSILPLRAPAPSRVLVATDFALPPDAPFVGQLHNEQSQLKLSGVEAVALSAAWTLVHIVDQQGDLLASSIITDDAGISAPVLAKLESKRCGYGSAPAGWLSPQMFGTLLRYAADNAGISRTSPAVLKVVGDFSRLDTSLARTCAELGLYTIVSPTDGASLCHEGNQGIVSDVIAAYVRTYLNLRQVAPDPLMVDHKMIVAAKSLAEVSAATVEAAGSYVGLRAGQLPKLSRWTLDDFEGGALFRDAATLPDVTRSLLDETMTVENLARPFGSPIVRAAKRAAGKRKQGATKEAPYRLSEFPECSNKAMRVMFRGEREGEGGGGGVAETVPAVCDDLAELLDATADEHLLASPRLSTTFGFLLNSQEAREVLERADERVAVKTKEMEKLERARRAREK